MTIYAVICTRSRDDVTKTTDNLLRFFVTCGIKVYLISGAHSIFHAYHGAFEKINPEDDDIFIMCHDDIEIRDDAGTWLEKLKKTIGMDGVGFVGPAGTMDLGPTAVWWDQDRWARGKHRGTVYHINPQGREYKTYYGEEGSVAVLDGLFLAAKAKTLRDIGLKKPGYFKGEWDFYDIHYTSEAFLKGYDNRVMEMDILHNSRGELVGRDSWHTNREAFINRCKLPLKVKA